MSLETRFGLRHMDPSRVCPTVLKDIKSYAQAVRRKDGHFFENDLEYMRSWAAGDRETHGLCRGYVNMLLGSRGRF